MNRSMQFGINSGSICYVGIICSCPSYCCGRWDWFVIVRRFMFAPVAQHAVVRRKPCVHREIERSAVCSLRLSHFWLAGSRKWFLSTKGLTSDTSFETKAQCLCEFLQVLLPGGANLACRKGLLFKRLMISSIQSTHCVSS